MPIHPHILEACASVLKRNGFDHRHPSFQSSQTQDAAAALLTSKGTMPAPLAVAVVKELAG
jgi:hypothetical protein